ncbi:MAG: hypothetical protein IJK18_02695 [Clostridia bacterium]|nr:hypothetical protein [Clostridia bacterium]
MGLEMRRSKIEKGDLDSFQECKWDNKQQSEDRNIRTREELQDIKNLLASLSEEPIFDEQEAGKATINEEVQDKDDEKSFEEMSNEEILKRIENLFR